MTPIYSIVEGEGEVKALPELLKKLRNSLSPDKQLYHHKKQPIRISRGKITQFKPDFINQLKAQNINSMRDNGWVLIVVDADDDCPVELARKIHNIASQHIPHGRISVVIPNKEYEAWFLASANSMANQNLPSEHQSIALSGNLSNVDNIKDAKGRITIDGKSYSETGHQEILTKMIDVNIAEKNSRSFRKLCKEWRRMAEWKKTAASC